MFWGQALGGENEAIIGLNPARFLALFGTFFENSSLHPKPAFRPG